jgi:hypothetical protein
MKNEIKLFPRLNSFAESPLESTNIILRLYWRRCHTSPHAPYYFNKKEWGPGDYVTRSDVVWRSLRRSHTTRLRHTLLPPQE